MGKDKERAPRIMLAEKHHLHLKRKIFHACNGLLIFSIYQWEMIGWLTGGLLLLPFVVLAWGLEVGRLKSPALNQAIIKYTGHIMRANEVAKPSGRIIPRVLPLH